MARVTEEGMMHATSLVCDQCGHRETDLDRGLGAVMARGLWAQSMISRQRHLCGGCYRALEPMAREGYWRRPPLLDIDGGPLR